jgi:hypothetical protein
MIIYFFLIHLYVYFSSNSNLNFLSFCFRGLMNENERDVIFFPIYVMIKMKFFFYPTLCAFVENLNVVFSLIENKDKYLCVYHLIFIIFLEEFMKFKISELRVKRVNVALIFHVNQSHE